MVDPVSEVSWAGWRCLWCLHASWRDCPLCGPFYRALQGRPCYHYWLWGYFTDHRRWIMGTLARRPERGQGLPGPDWKPAGLLAKYPVIAEWLSKSIYEDGSARVTSTFNVFFDEGVVKVAFNDRDCERTLWASGESLEAALKSIEQKLDVGTNEWRESKYKKGKVGK